MNIIFSLPEYINYIFEVFDSIGEEVYLVGGSVRDMIIGNSPSDYDMTTNLRPSELERLFEGFKTIGLGRKFGTIGVVIDNNIVEITTYRKDGAYLDGRRPSNIVFSENLYEDLKRRDFTINAIAYNPKTGIIDPFNGILDMKKNVIRAVGDPKLRFNEDGLRIMRCLRFASKFNFQIEDITKEAILDCRNNLYNISNERIRDELFKILMTNKPSIGIELLRKNKILEIILPEVIPMIGFEQNNPNHNLDVYEHTLRVIDNSNPKIHIRLSALFHDIGKPMTFSLDEDGIGHFYGHEKTSIELTEKILKRLNVSKELIDIVIKFIDRHMLFYNDMTEKGYKRLLNKIGKDYIFDFIELQKADRLGTKNKDVDDILIAKNKIEGILNAEEAYDKKDLAINGIDVIELGYKEGRIIGEILEYLLDIVMERDELNQKDILIDIIKDKF